MPLPAIALPLAISGISALAGIFGNRKQKAQSEQTQTTDVSNMPQYDDRTLYMRNALMDQFMDRLRFNDDYFGGYTREGLGNINRASDIASQNIQNALNARGLGGSSAGISSAVQAQLNRLNQQSSFLNSIPLLRDQRASQNLAAASGFWDKIPIGTRQTGTTTTRGTTTTPSNMIAGGLAGLGGSLAYLYGRGAFNKSGGTTVHNPPIPDFPDYESDAGIDPYTGRPY